MHNVKPASRLWLLGIFAVFSLPCLAAESPVSADTGNVTIGQLEAIQSRNFLLEQQVQTARLTRQLRESESEIQMSQASPVANSPAPLPFIPSGSPTAGAEQQATRAPSEKSVPAPVRLQEIYVKGRAAACPHCSASGWGDRDFSGRSVAGKQADGQIGHPECSETE